MNRIWKTVIAGVIIAVGGVIVLLCALGASGWDMGNITEWQEDTYTAANEVTKLEIKANAGSVIIKRGKTDTVTVKYEHNDVYKTEINQNSTGALSIEAGKKEWYKLTFWYQDAPTTEIEIGENCNPTIDLTLNAGNVYFCNGDWGKRVDVTVNAGLVEFSDLKSYELNVKINAGAMRVNKIDCQQVKCELNAGKFETKEMICDKFDCNISAGVVNVKKLDSSTIKVDVSAGSVNLNVAGSKSSYTISVDKSVGSCNVSNQQGVDSTKRIDIDISAGSVTITFEK